MDIMDAIDLMKHFGIYNEAKRECEIKRIDKSPYDMQGHHRIYCSHLDKKWVQLRNRRDELQNIKCKEWDNLALQGRPLHDDCKFAYYSITDYCQNNCMFYKDIIKKLEDEMVQVKEASNLLKKAAEEDYRLK